MKKRTLIAVLMAASMMLTACDKKEDNKPNGNNAAVPQLSESGLSRDIYQMYKDFMDYTFKGQYTISEPETAVYHSGTEYEQEIYTRNVTFTTKNGREMTEPLISTSFIATDAEMMKTWDNQDIAEFDSFVTLTMGNIARDEFAERIVSKYITDMEYNAVSDTFITPEAELTILSYPPVYIGGLEESQFDKSVEIVKNRLSPESGYCIADADLESICSSKDFTFSCKLILDEGVDSSKYIGIMENIIKDFEEMIGTPQNYSFFFGQVNNEEWYLRKMCMMGEEVPAEKIDSADYSFSSELKAKIVEKY